MRPTSGERGETVGSNSGTLQTQVQSAFTEGPANSNQFAGAGPLLEDPDAVVFESVHQLVQRQELLALNHLAQDTHWTLVKLGYPWSTLTHDTQRDKYTQALPYGSSGITIQAVPNKTWDLIIKTTESLLVDFPESTTEPGSDSEEAQATCEMADRFLSQDAGEQGTNDAVLWNDRVSRALVTATSYLEVWTDPMGGGYVPLQIKAHPGALSPDNALVGPNGEPTTDYVLRYVTAPTGGQFTDDPSKAAPQWQPKLRATKWQREHIRVYPETATVKDADKLIILGYCTLNEAKKRWPAVAQLKPEDLSALTDWTPTRYLVLLPPFQRARWKLSDGKKKDKAGSSDERIMFYYHVFAKASADYKKGADVVVTGANVGNAGVGFLISRKLLSKPVTVQKGQPAPTQQAGPAGAPQPPQSPTPQSVTEIRCMEIPVVDITPCSDPDEADPSGRAFVERFAGAVESNASLASGFAQILEQNLHPDRYIPSTSPVEGWEVDNSRATGDAILLAKPEDKPFYGTQPELPAPFLSFYEMSDEAINSMASSERASTGADNSKERSGKALQIAINRNNVSLSGMQTAVNNAYARFCRLKIEHAMSDFTTSQMIGYVGEDGAYKQDEWTGADFALIGKVTVKTGTGTMMTPEQKVDYLGNLAKNAMLQPDEAADAARPAYSKTLGLPPDPHQQRIERQVASWLKGPPSPEWITQYQGFQQAQQQYQVELQQYQQAAAAYQQQEAVRQQNEVASHAQGLQDQSKQIDVQAKTQESAAQRQHALDLERVKAELTLKAGDHARANTPAPAPPAVHEPAPHQPPAVIHLHVGGKKTTVIRKNPDGSMSAESTPEESVA